jgi:stage V sporulation protein G
MEITEIRVNLVGGPAERVKAFCTITLDGGFVVRDLKIIEGPSGLFLAMPSRKLADRCPRCAAKNPLRARYCNHCGARLNENRAPRDEQGRVKLHADVAHPINAECRDAIQTAVVNAFHAEVERSSSPGYEPAADIAEEFAGVEYDEFMESSPGNQAPIDRDPPRQPSPADPVPIDRAARASRQPLEHAGQSNAADKHGDRAPSPRITPSPRVTPQPHGVRAIQVAADEDDNGFGAGIL